MTDHGRSKYKREVPCIESPNRAIVDVYSVLVAFNVTCPARAHAIKKLLCAGIRGKGGSLQDLQETKVAVERAIQLEHDRIKVEQRQGKQETKEGKYIPHDEGKFAEIANADVDAPGQDVQGWNVYMVMDEKKVNPIGFRVGWHCDDGSYFLVCHYMAAEKDSDGPSLSWCKHAAERQAKQFNEMGKLPSEFPGWGNHRLETKSNV